MPNVDLIKLKIRRGTNTERQTVVFDQGELAYTTDTKRVFVGDSATLGGAVVGNKNFPPTTLKTSITGAEIGDTVLENSIYYQLTASNAALSASWAQISPKTDNTSIRYNTSNQLSVLVNGISSGMSAAIADHNTIIQSGGKLSTGTLYLTAAAPSTVTYGLCVSPAGLQINEDPLYFEYNGQRLTLQDLVIPNTKITLSADPQYFDTSAGMLRLTSFSLPDDIITFDPSFFSVNVSFSGGYTTFSDNLSVYRGNNSLSAAYVGNLDGNGYPQTTRTVLTAFNTSTSQHMMLSSAGFLTLSRNITGNGLVDKRIAIPIFTY
jgi:hypothetical protein